MPDKEKEYRKALLRILILAADDEGGDKIEAIKNIANQIFK